MLILCIGPDTFRAQRKARELEQAFRQKYDADGTSVEKIAPGKSAVDDVLERANTVSLFSPRRFLRTQDLFADPPLPKAKIAALRDALLKEPDHVIVVSMESERPASTVLKALNGAKVIIYEYLPLKPNEFQDWVRQEATKVGVTDEKVVQDIILLASGDGWSVSNELIKSAAGCDMAKSVAEKEDLYRSIGRCVLGERGALASQASQNVTPIINACISQARSAMRRSRTSSNSVRAFSGSVLAFIAQRSGLSQEDECFDLF